MGSGRPWVRSRLHALFTLFLVAVGASAILWALHWPFKAALFPLAVGVPLVILGMAQLTLDLVAGTEVVRGPGVDLAFSTEVEPRVANRRAIAIFAWIAGFILLVLLVGFPVAVPLFVFSYLSRQGPAGWWRSLTLTAAAWGFFYGIFQRLLHLPFEGGWIQTWLGI